MLLRMDNLVHGAFTKLFLFLCLNLCRTRLPGMNKGTLAIKGGDMNALHPVERLESRVQALEEAIESEASYSKGPKCATRLTL